MINKYWVIIGLLISMLLSGFTFRSKSNALATFSEVKLLAPDAGKYTICAYKVPPGEFRGALWPTKNSQYFQVWLKEGNKDKYMKVAIPKNFMKYKDATQDWSLSSEILSNGNISYSFLKKDSNDFVQVTLPSEIDYLSLSVLRNSIGEDLLIFMNMSEEEIENGIFGFIVGKSENHVCSTANTL